MTVFGTSTYRVGGGDTRRLSAGALSSPLKLRAEVTVSVEAYLVTALGLPLSPPVVLSLDSSFVRLLATTFSPSVSADRKSSHPDIFRSTVGYVYSRYLFDIGAEGDRPLFFCHSLMA